MEDLFPLTIDIPDNVPGSKDNYNFIDVFNSKIKSIFVQETNCFCFLISSKADIKEINIDAKNKIYLLGKIKKDQEILFIYYIETFVEFPKSKIKLLIQKNTFFIKINDINNDINNKIGKIFLFNYCFFDINDKKSYKLNCFDIYEEFEIYYRIHSEKKNINSLNSLISSALHLFNKGKEESNFALFLRVFMKDPLKIIKNKNIENILFNIKNKGDLSKINKDELYKIIKDSIKEKYSFIIYLIYILLSQQLSKEFKLLTKSDKINIFYCLDKFQNLLSHSFQFFPNFIFLIDMTASFDEIKRILNCSNSLTDFIYSINERKEHILNYITEKNKLILNDLFDLEIAFNKEFDEKFYFILNNIKEFERNNNKKILYLDDGKIEYEKYKKNNFQAILIRILIFSFIKDKKLLLPSEEVLNNLDNISKNHNNPFNNFEIIEIFDILSNEYNEKLYEEFLGTLTFLINSIKFEKINNDLKLFFSKIKWDIFFQDQNVFPLISNMVSSLKNIENFEFVYIIIDKLIKREKIISKGDKVDNEYKEIIIFAIGKLIPKYFSLLPDIKKIEKDKKEGLVKITSKLIFFIYKYKIDSELLQIIAEEIEPELLNKIFISICIEYEEVSDLIFNNLISILIKKEKFGIFLDLLLKDKFYSKFENLLNKYIINDDIEQFLEKEKPNNILLDNLNKFKFFELHKETYYVKETIKKLKNIGNNIIKIDINLLSLKQMEMLSKEKDKINIISLIDGDKNFKDKIVESLEKKIKIFRSVIGKSKEILNLLESLKFKFSGKEKLLDSFKKYIEILENNKINFDKNFEVISKKIDYILELLNILEKKITTNYFYKKIKEKNMNFSLFEYLLFVFNDKNLEKINADLFPLFESFLMLKKEEKKK